MLIVTGILEVECRVCTVDSRQLKSCRKIEKSSSDWELEANNRKKGNKQIGWEKNTSVTDTSTHHGPSTFTLWLHG